MMCSRPEEDSHRFMDTIDAAIKAGEVASSKRYKMWAAKVKAKPGPLDPANNKKAKTGNGADMALVAQIRCDDVFAGPNDTVVQLQYMLI